MNKIQNLLTMRHPHEIIDAVLRSKIQFLKFSHGKYDSADGSIFWKYNWIYIPSFSLDAYV